MDAGVLKDGSHYSCKAFLKELRLEMTGVAWDDIAAYIDS